MYGIMLSAFLLTNATECDRTIVNQLIFCILNKHLYHKISPDYFHILKTIELSILVKNHQINH